MSIGFLVSFIGCTGFPFVPERVCLLVAFVGSTGFPFA